MALKGVKVNPQDLKKKENVYLGVDMGGSHFGVVAVDESGKLISKASVNIKFKESKDEAEQREKEKKIIETLTELINECNSKIDMDKYNVASIGFGVPGTFKGTNIINLSNVGLQNFDLGVELRKKFPEMGLDPSVVNIYMENDATCATIAELYDEEGVLRDKKTGGVATLGTGFGYKGASDGIIDKGQNGHGSEFGHIIIDRNSDEKCACGNNGCLECFTSVKRLRERISKILGLEVNKDESQDKTIDGIDLEAILFKVYQRPISAKLQKQLDGGKNKTKDILDLIANSPKIEEIQDAYMYWLEAISIAGAGAVNAYDIDTFVLGGSAAYFISSEDLEYIKTRINEMHNKKGAIDCEPKISKLANDAGVKGAALIPIYYENVRQREIAKAREILVREGLAK